MPKRHKIVNFIKSPAGQRLMIWALPMIISFASKLFGGKKSKRKR